MKTNRFSSMTDLIIGAIASIGPTVLISFEMNRHVDDVSWTRAMVAGLWVALGLMTSYGIQSRKISQLSREVEALKKRAE